MQEISGIRVRDPIRTLAGKGEGRFLRHGIPPHTEDVSKTRSNQGKKMLGN